ncbi:MAG: hypothetical protein IAE87_07230 [Rhodobacteraceae bacterium]|nr:hypothetical protein [Paracoccaceae bacterium]
MFDSVRMCFAQIINFLSQGANLKSMALGKLLPLPTVPTGWPKAHIALRDRRAETNLRGVADGCFV